MEENLYTGPVNATAGPSHREDTTTVNLVPAFDSVPTEAELAELARWLVLPQSPDGRHNVRAQGVPMLMINTLCRNQRTGPYPALRTSNRTSPRQARL